MTSLTPLLLGFFLAYFIRQSKRNFFTFTKETLLACYTTKIALKCFIVNDLIAFDIHLPKCNIGVGVEIFRIIREILLFNALHTVIKFAIFQNDVNDI